MNDFRVALRAFVRKPGATFVDIATLAVAIATATILASTIDAVWHFIPATRSDRLVFVASMAPGPAPSPAGVSNRVSRTGVSIPDLVDWSERTRVFEQFAGLTFGSASLTGVALPVRVSMVRVTRNLLDVWGIRPPLGRTFRPEEAQAGGDRVAVVSHLFWERQLGSAPDVLSKVLILDGQAHTIVGVLPAETSTGILKTADVMVPIVLDRSRAPREERRLFVTGVLKPGATLREASSDLDTVARQLQQEHPRTNANTGVVVRPFIEMLGESIRTLLFLLGFIGVLVVCIACANVASLILARTATRRRDLSVRAALGASRFAQIRHILAESFVSSSLAGIVGLALAWWGLMAIQFAGRDLEFIEMTLNGRVLAAGIALTLVAPFGCALLPAIRMSKPDMDELRQGNRGAESTRGRRLRESLVALQVALALILITQVGLIGRTTWKIHYLEKGFDPTQVLTLRIDLSEATYPQPYAVEDFFEQALDDIRALPGVASAGAVTRLPIAGAPPSSLPFAIQGMPAPTPESRPQAARSGISTDYLSTMRIPLVRGRGLAEADFRNAPAVALVNQEAARRYWPGQDPIGRRISFADGSKPEWIEVVGIVGNVRSSSVESAPAPQIYTPSSLQPARSMAIVVRSAAADPTPLGPAIRGELAQLDKNQPVYAIDTMEHVLVADLGGTYLLTGMLAVIGVVALVLAAAGVYGLVSYSVSQRTREIGLRMALGARPAEILGMVVTRGSLPLAVGLVVGAVGAALLVTMTSRAMEEIDLRDPIGYVVVAVPLVLVALLATYLPARRATQVDPLLALRAD